MNMNIERIRRHIEGLPADGSKMADVNEVADYMIADKVIQWLFCNLLPVLLATLIIDVAFMFVAPGQVIRSDLFWLKDPISLAAGYAIVRLVRSLFVHNSHAA